ncbi:MAG: DUF6174 domain-containing protein [Anaerolineales bacterium]|nr:MAG: DUF6174 domain-containing protein [Anaerolineales bacterium]
MKKLILISMVFILAACSAGGSELERNRQTWQDAGVSHYRMDLSLSCFCVFNELMPLSVEVKDGKVVSLADKDGNPISADDPNYSFFVGLGTVDALFADLESAMKSPEAGDITVKYDAALGFPTEAQIDYIKEAVDDELYVTVSGFEQLP